MKDNVTVNLSLSSHIRRVAMKRFLDLGREETGAALVITLAMFLLMYLGIMGVFAVSTAMKERIHLQNACDAAAYSAAVVQADTLSRIATINRAMSWTYVQMTRRQMDYIVLRWLTHTIEHYDIDQKGASAYNKEGVLHDPCNGHGSICIGWFIGTNPRRIDTAYRMRLNGLDIGSYFGVDSMPGSEVTSFLNLGSTPLRGEVENVLKGYKTSAVYNEIRNSGLFSNPTGGDYNISNDKSLEALKNEALDISLNEPLSNVETADSIRMMWSQLNRVNNKYKGHGNGIERILQAQIVLDRLNIALMNISERRLVREMTENIASVVKNIVSANIPTYMTNKCAYFLSQNEDPLDGEMTGFGNGYFVNLYNTEVDEKRFLRFAGFTSSLVDVYMNAHSDEVTGQRSFEDVIDNISEIALRRTASGVNQWFVRGGTRMNTNGGIQIGRTDGERGLQRCYKHWAEGPFSNIHPTYNPLPPSSWNTNDDYLEGSPATVALFSEWCWWSDVWSCIPIYTPFGKKTIHIPLVPHKRKFSPMKMECNHNDEPGLFGTSELRDSADAIGDLAGALDDVKKIIEGIANGVTEESTDEERRDAERKIDDIIAEFEGNNKGGVGTYNNGDTSNLENFSSSGIDNYEDGCLITLPVLNLTSHVVGYARLYADAPQIYNSCYVGERAKPLILSGRYFGRAGTISVGIRRENENVFLRILGAIEGIFKAFDPDWNGSGEKTYSYVFSSAKAGYKNKDDSASIRAYKVDWDETNQEWNLCQSDWDAVFIPVRHAYSYALGIGGVASWVEGEDNMLEDWVTSDSWKTLDGDTVDSDESYSSVIAPGGILLGNGHDGVLDWRGLSHVMYH